MSTLHQLNNSHKLETCLPLLAAGDQLLLIESAVTLLQDQLFLQRLPPQVQLLALGRDVKARGLMSTCSASIQLLSDEEWVAACLEVDRVCSW
jgi:sulfur relay protein TusB/DsrH